MLINKGKNRLWDFEISSPVRSLLTS